TRSAASRVGAAAPSGRGRAPDRSCSKGQPDARVDRVVLFPGVEINAEVEVWPGRGACGALPAQQVADLDGRAIGHRHGRQVGVADPEVTLWRLELDVDVV